MGADPILIEDIYAAANSGRIVNEEHLQLAKALCAPAAYSADYQFSYSLQGSLLSRGTTYLWQERCDPPHVTNLAFVGTLWYGFDADIDAVLKRAPAEIWMKFHGKPVMLSPLAAAAMRSDARTVGKIAKAEAVNRYDTAGRTPLFYATHNDRSGVVQVLLAAGADPKVVDMEGSTPLHWAAAANQYRNCMTLLEHGADIEAKNAAGRTPFLTAAMNAAYSGGAALVNAGADVFAVDGKGNTAAHILAQAFGLNDRVKLFTRKDMFTRKNKDGFLPLDLAWTRPTLCDEMRAAGAVYGNKPVNVWATVLFVILACYVGLGVAAFGA